MAAESLDLVNWLLNKNACSHFPQLVHKSGSMVLALITAATYPPRSYIGQAFSYEYASLEPRFDTLVAEQMIADSMCTDHYGGDCCCTLQRYVCCQPPVRQERQGPTHEKGKARSWWASVTESASGKCLKSCRRLVTVTTTAIVFGEHQRVRPVNG